MKRRRYRRIPLDQSYTVTDAGCWEWNRHISPDGYGKAHINGTVTNAHRVVWMELVGPIPVGLTLDHLCRNKPCVNPAHLEPVTAAENIRRSNLLRTRCHAGHPFDEANTYIDPRGNRNCRACRREQSIRHRLNKEARRVIAA